MPEKNNGKEIWLRRVRRWGDFWLRILTSSFSRLVIVLIAFGLMAYLLYVNAWIPLQREASAPGGISLQVPVIDSTMLERISEHHTLRVQHAREIYVLYDALFAVPSIPTPTPQPILVPSPLP